MTPIGLDIGGAHLKASDGQSAVSIPFALWKSPEQLPSALRQLLASYSKQAPLAVTMTGELADCFATRTEGVRHILKSVQAAAGLQAIWIWQTGGEFLTVDEAWELTDLVAAANWHALATWAARMSPAGRSLIIDIGSTTSDFTCIEEGLPAPRGSTDRERLTTGELLYLGVRRTPLCAVAHSVRLRDQQVACAREVFATTLDLGLLLGEIDETPDNFATANGRPATRAHAADRLARMLCSDCTDLTAEELQAIAREMAAECRRLVADSLTRAWGQTARPERILLAGEGEFLARQTLQAEFPDWKDVETLSLASLWGAARSQAACAEALSRLASERLVQGQ
jgi:probable H4MPT-linked C1 transfer pathway protein